MVDAAAQTIARAVRARRLELHLSTHEASERARIPEKSWRVIEQGLSLPSALVLGALCRALEWPPSMIDSLLERELQVTSEGEMVVDLDAGERASDEAPAAEAPTLDASGLSPAQVAEVQAYIEYLRKRTR